MSRFDYIKYDTQTELNQNTAKGLVSQIESFIEDKCKSSRAKALALTKLEECYMWIGKALRDDQIQTGGSNELQEERKNG